MSRQAVKLNEVYDYIPSILHRSGDIWTSLPTFGLLPQSLVTGIVITPACDFVNTKTETITYLPIISLSQMFHSRIFLREAKISLNNILRRLGLFEDARKLNEIFFNQFDLFLDNLSRKIQDEKAIKCIEYIKDILISDKSRNSVRGLGEKNYKEIKERIIKNARSEFYFLPADNQLFERSGIVDHSCVLFRYPCTIHLDLLDAANDISILDWESFIENEMQFSPMATLLVQRPLKVLNLKNSFFADMISKYVSLYFRIGSPDFSEGQIEQFLEIDS